MQLAREQGIPAPVTAHVRSIHELRAMVERIGLPIVLKADGTYGGKGVRVARSMEEAESAFQSLRTMSLLWRAAKRSFSDRDMSLLWPSQCRRSYGENVQEFVFGGEGTSAVACWNGAVLASLHFEVIARQYPGGPATVMRRIENSDMSEAVYSMVERLGLSGMHGFDFMLEADTGRAYLIEINPRVTQVGHLALGSGRDLPSAFYAAVSGKPIREAAKATECETIALFPQEWLRDPKSPYLLTSYHDVPWEEPKLVRACIRRRHEEWAGYAQLKSTCALATVSVPQR
ncbi:MAG: ATP-grasp domain-containing protein [Candidatus Acidiferrales bacterium]